MTPYRQSAPYEPKPPRMHDLGLVHREFAPLDASTPGSTTALTKGCTCPVRSNNCGAGTTARNWGESRRTRTPDARDYWLVDRDCGLHGHLREAAP